MDQRKLIKLGNSSFAIALPKSWVNKSELKKGDTIFITPNSKGELIIQPKYQGGNGEKRIDMSLEGKDSQTLRRELSAHYVNGYTLFCINGKRNREINETIKKTIEELIGIEIIKNESGEIIAKDLFNMEEIDLNNFVRRMDNNLREMFGIIVEGFSKKKISRLQISDVAEADSDINKFYLLISRILSIGIDNPSVLIKLKIENLRLVSDWWFAFNLEHIGDQIKSIIKIIKNEPLEEKEYGKFTKLSAQLRNIYANSLDFFYDRGFDKEKALGLTNEGKKIWEELNRLTLNKKSTVAKIAMKLKEIETFIYQNIKMVLNNRGQNGK